MTRDIIKYRKSCRKFVIIVDLDIHIIRYDIHMIVCVSSGASYTKERKRLKYKRCNKIKEHRDKQT